MKRHGWLTAVALCSLFLFPAQVRASGETVAQDGVYVQGISVGGMTKSEAKDAIDEYFSGIAAAPFSITCTDGESIEIPLSDWNFTWDSDSAAESAIEYGNSGPLIARYKEQMDLRYGNIYLDVSYEVDYDAVADTLADEVAAHDNPAKDAVLTREDGEFVVVSSEEDGTVCNQEATQLDILEELAEHLGTSMSVTVTTETDHPEITTADFSEIKDELGTFTTEYGSSSKGRKTNIRIATENTDGTVLMPGQSASASELFGARTKENGYQTASQYSNGESEKAIGGGICQVSTTLYNALLRAELQIDERHPHSMVVSYVDYGDDAAIAKGSKDLVFTNNQDTPVYIQGSADGDTLTFTIYGKETRPANRVVTFEAETTSIEWPDDRKVAYSDSIPSGESEISGTVRPEVTATLTKVVTVDGVETERTLLHTDYYSASRQTITYGTG